MAAEFTSDIPEQVLVIVETALSSYATYDRTDQVEMGEPNNIIKFDWSDETGQPFVYYLTITRSPLDKLDDDGNLVD